MTQSSAGDGGERSYEVFEAAFHEAAAAVGGVVRVPLEVAGIGVALDFAGPALVERMSAPFAHLRSGREPEIVLQCWESETTGIELPHELDPLGVHLSSLPAAQREAPTRWSHVRPDPGITGYHSALSRAVYWFPSSSGLTFGDLAGGLRSAFAWSMGDRGLSFLHTAGVGWKGKGALIVGASGSGKSSTALTCLLAGLDFLGDDHCLVSRGPRSTVHAVYGAAKLHTEQMLRFPELLPLIVNEDRNPWDKAVAILHPRFARQLPAALPVDALFVPRISEQRKSTIAPLSRGQALLALAPSTLLQMTAVDREALSPMAELVRNVPCYLLTVGADRAHIAETIRGFLETCE